MKLVKQSFEILNQNPGLEGIYEAIERAGRTCYKSKRPEGQTAKDFVDRMIKSGHNSMLEHGTVYLYSTYDVSAIGSWYDSIGRRYSENKYSIVNTDEKMDFRGIYVTTNIRVLQENGWLDDLQYLCEPTEFHEKRVTVRFTCGVDISREFNRHRVNSIAEQSTRYCNYSKDKFGNEITYIIPSCIKEIPYLDENNHFDYNSFVRSNLSTVDHAFYGSLKTAEDSYLTLIENGWKPENARKVLPLDLATELVHTAFISDWKHFFRLRTSILAETGMPHPDASALADPLYKEFVNRNLING